MAALSGKIALVTGAERGIGREIALRLARDGATLRVNFLADAAAAEAVCAEIRALGAEAQALQADVSDADAVSGMFSQIPALDILVNNAGVGSPKPVHEAADEDYDAMMNIMLRAPFRLIREVIPHLGEGASVVNVTSTFAHIGGRRGGAYSAAKGGLKSLTEHMACEYGPRGIRSNCVAPGVTMTDMVAHRFEDEVFKRANVETTPYPRLANPEDIASVIAFLCSDGSLMINGQSIVVDGGWTNTKYLSPRATTTKWVDPD